MRIGFVSIYSFRPHVEHVYYLSLLAQQAGHEARFLTCDAQLSQCYTRALKGRSAWVECPKCIAGGLRSYTGGVSRLPMGSVLPAQAQAWADSSACTALRIESAADRQTADFFALREQLAAGVARAYAAAHRWIEREALDAVVCFNGRMDATRGVCEAAAAQGISYLTVERTWFGDGLQFSINGNALDLSQLDRLNAQYRDVPLSAAQARRVARQLAARFLGRNDKEWRAYNRDAVSASWPRVSGQKQGPRVLLLPGSRNEVEGHPHWTHGWSELSEGFDAVLDALGASPGDCVLRCHPNWGEYIGRHTGARSETYYTEWARRRGVSLIGSREAASTLDLIREADVILVNGGSAAFEACCMGKPVVSITPSTYRAAGMVNTVMSPEQLVDLRSSLVPQAQRVRRALRYGYTHIYRFSQYVDFVHALSTTRYRYAHGADPLRIERMLVTGQIEPDDALRAEDEQAEDEVVAQIQARDWDGLMNWAEADATSRPAPTYLTVQRRAGLRWMDALRERFALGDR